MVNLARLIKNTFYLLSIQSKRKIILLSVLQSLSNLLDLLSIYILGSVTFKILGQEKNNVDINNNVLEIKFLKFELNLNFISTISLVCLLFAIRTALSLALSRSILLHLSELTTKFTKKSIHLIFKEKYLSTTKKTEQEVIFMITRGFELLFIQILGGSIIIVADFSLLILLSTLILILDSTIALILFGTLAVSSYLVYFQTHKKAERLGNIYSKSSIETNEFLTNVFSTYKEFYVRNLSSYISDRVFEIKKPMIKAVAELNYLPYVSKYVFEGSILLVAFLIGSFSYFRGNLESVVVSLVMIVAAGSRIAPAVLRIQQGILQMKGVQSLATESFNILLKLNVSIKHKINHAVTDYDYYEVASLENVSFKYPEGHSNIINKVNLKIYQGDFILLKGKSGIGKSTLVDLILGVIKPDEGIIKLFNQEPEMAIADSNGQIVYLPQSFQLLDGKVSDNFIFQEIVSENSTSVNMSMENIKIALANIFEEFSPEDILDIQIREGGKNLSGGQKQRIGIIRNLINNPKLIIIDEGTNAVDFHTEEKIYEYLKSNFKYSAFVLISHNTLAEKYANRILNFENGYLIEL